MRHTGIPQVWVVNFEEMASMGWCLVTLVTGGMVVLLQGGICSRKFKRVEVCGNDDPQEITSNSNNAEQ